MREPLPDTLAVTRDWFLMNLDAYCSHRPLLWEALRLTPGTPVLELGMGHGSTPYLARYCEQETRALYSAEADPAWYLRMVGSAGSAGGKHLDEDLTGGERTEIDVRGAWRCSVLVPGGNWDKVPQRPCQVPLTGTRWSRDQWGVALIDHAPAGRRIVDIERLRDSALMLVVHDTEEDGYAYEPELTRFRYRKDDERVKVRTALVSNFIDVSKVKLPQATWVLPGDL